MAKKQNKAELLEYFSNLIVVDSRQYKKHVRAKRGTYTPITLPEAFKANLSTQKLVNQQAKIVNDVVIMLASKFKNSKFWTRILSELRKNGSINPEIGYLALNGMDVRLEYPLHKLFALRVKHELTGPKFKSTSFKCNEIAVLLHVIRVSNDFTKIEQAYQWKFGLDNKNSNDDIQFDLQGLQKFKVAVEKEKKSIVQGVEDAKEKEEFNMDFIYDASKRGRYVAFLCADKLFDGNLHPVLANKGMQIFGF